MKNKKANEEKAYMKGFKAFNYDMTCRGKQYKENTIFEEDNASICNCGMHFCKEPLKVLDYYPLVDENGNMTQFAEVEALDECLTDDDEKFCTKKLKIGAKLDFAKLVNIAVNFDYKKEKVIGNDILNDNGGNSAQIGSSGNYAQIGSSGDYARIGSSGDYARIGSSGDYAQIGSSGYSARIGSSGDYARIGSSGDSAQISSTGKDSVIMCAGVNSIAKAKKGSWITLAEWKYDDKKSRYVPINVVTKKVDGKKIKEDTYYKLKNGQFVEVED